MVLMLFTFQASSQMKRLYLDAKDHNYIKKISFYSPSQGYVAFTDWIGFTTDSGHTFTKKPITSVDFNGYTVNLALGFGINGVKAFSKDSLIVYGDYGLVPSILYSTNGGNTFKLVFYSQFNPAALNSGITDLSFPENKNVGYAIDADRILKTTDRGATWTTSTVETSSFFNYIENVDDDTVFVISNRQTHKVKYSINGGGRWFNLRLPPGEVNYVHFITGLKGWISMTNDNGGSLYYTPDRGTTWIQKTVNEIQPFDCVKMKFINDNTGFAIADDTYTTLKTLDSGKTWAPLPRDNNFSYQAYSHEDLFFLNNDRFWAGGWHGFLEFTTNGGGEPLPVSLFKADTTNSHIANVVNLTNYSRPGLAYKWFVNGQFLSTSYHASYVHNIYRPIDTIALVISDGVYSDTSFKYPEFNAIPYPPPLVSSYTPETGGPGSIITIKGDFFVDVTGVSFGGVPAKSFSVNSINQITAMVGEGGNGNVSVTTVKGTGSLPGFIVFPPPIITSFSPNSAAVGASISITGKNFSPVPAENFVYFGGVRAQVTAASPTRLTVVVPPGAAYQPISVMVNNHTGYSTLWFKLTFASTCNFTDRSFAAAQSFTMEDGAYDGVLRTADMDNDGKVDIVHNRLDGVAVFKNLGEPGSINFDPVIYVKDLRQPGGLAIGDLDGDGKMDIVMTNRVQPVLTILRNTTDNGTVSFAPPMNITLTAVSMSAVITDLDLDGRLDIAITKSVSTGNQLAVFRNTSVKGAISLAPVQEFLSGRNPTKLLAGDLDSDGKPDFIIEDPGLLNSGVHTFSIHRNTSTIGTISFAPVTTVRHHTISAKNLDIGDLDGDGKLDVMEVYDVSYTLGSPKPTAYYRNTSTPGAISFAASVGIDGCSNHSTVALGDLDGDNRIDAFRTCDTYGSYSDLLRNTSTGGNISFTNVSSNVAVLAGDFSETTIRDLDGDGRPDLIGANPGLLVYRNTLNQKGILAGKDTTVCAGQTLKIGGPPATNPNHIYSWSSSPAGFTSALADPVISPMVSTDYFIEVTNPQGCASYDTIRVTVGSGGVIVNAGKDSSICEGGSKQLGSAPIDSYTYSWASLPAGFNSTLANPTVSPKETTVYIVSANSGSCIAKDTVVVTVHKLPVANAGPDRSVCSSDETQIGIAGSGNNIYNWTSYPAGFTSSAPNPVVAPGETTTYYLTVTYPAYCSSKDTVTLFVNPSPPVPVVSASGPLSICATGGSVTLTSSAASNNQWFRNGVAIPGATEQSYIATQTGNYRVDVNLGECISRSSLQIVTAFTASAPTITAGGPLKICKDGYVVLTSNAENGNQWFKDGVALPEETKQTFSATQTGIYTVKVTMGGCESTASNPISVEVGDTIAAPVITPGGPVVICGVGTINLRSSIAEGNQWYKNGVIIAGAIDQTLSVDEAGSYSTKIKIGNCESGLSNVVDVTVVDIPTPFITVQDSSSCGGPAILHSSADSGNQWYRNDSIIPGATGQQLVVTQPGIYTVVVSRAGCMVRTTQQVNIEIGPATLPPPTITASGSPSFCKGESSLLMSSAVRNQWYRNGVLLSTETGQTLKVTETGNYIARAWEDPCISEASNVIAILVRENLSVASISANGPIVFCEGESVLLISEKDTSNNMWYRNGTVIDGETNRSLKVDKTGIYTMKSTANGCPSVLSNAITVTVQPIPSTPVITQTNNTLVSSAASGNQWYLNGILIPGADGTSYLPVVSGSYTVVVTSNNCKSQSSAPFNFSFLPANSPGFADNIFIGPNPTADFVTIRYTGAPAKLAIVVSDVNGNRLLNETFSSGTYQLDLRRHAAGVYLVRIEHTQTGEHVLRLVMKL